MPGHTEFIPGGNEVRTHGYCLYLHIPDDWLECRCSYIPNSQGAMITREELGSALNQYSIVFGIDADALELFAEKAAEGESLKNVLLASGVKPISGEDEHLELLVVPPQKPDADEHSSVDMYLVQTFINVAAEEQIARIVPATAGIPGINIMGLPIPPPPGKPIATKIGKNIRREAESNLLIAATAGRVCQSPSEISVEDKFSVRGNVDFRVGSINFNGIVDVSGDVPDNFRVTASKGITVAGNIGACDVRCDGDIIVCGVDGGNKGTIYCGGTLRANFLHNVAVECLGDVIVGVEIHNCVIKALGKIVVDKGAISGGTCLARGGIEANILGSASYLRTRLHAGGDYRHIEEIERLIAEKDDELYLESTLKVETRIAESRKRRAELEERIADLQSNQSARADGKNCKVNVKSILYDNVHLTIGKTTEDMKELKDGAKTIIENSVDGGFRLLSTMTGLNVNADDIEIAFVTGQTKTRAG